MDWLKDGLGEPEEVVKATGEYRSEMDVLARFISDCCVTNTQKCTKSSELYRKYTEWSKDNGEFTLSQTKFSTRLQEKGFKKSVRSTGNYWLDIAIIDEDADDNPFINNGGY